MVSVGRGGGGEISLARVDMQFVTVFFGGNIDRTILAIAMEEGGFVGDEVAAADDLLEIVKAAAQTMHGAWREGGSAGKIGQRFQSMFAHQRTYNRVGHFTSTDGVDSDFAALGAIDCLFGGNAARVVASIADDDENSGDALAFGAAGEFVGGEGNGIPEGGTSGGYELADGVRDEFLVARKILDKENGVGEANHESEIIVAGHDLVKKVGGSILFEREAAGNGIACVDDEPQPQRQLGLVAESGYGGWRSGIVTDSDVFTSQGGDGFSVIRGRERN